MGRGLQETGGLVQQFDELFLEGRHLHSVHINGVNGPEKFLVMKLNGAKWHKVGKGERGEGSRKKRGKKRGKREREREVKEVKEEKKREEREKGREMKAISS